MSFHEVVLVGHQDDTILRAVAFYPERSGAIKIGGGVFRAILEHQGVIITQIKEKEGIRLLQ